MTMTTSRPTSLALVGLLSLLGATSASAAAIDKQTETAIPRTGNLYGLGIGVLPATSGSNELRTMVLPVIQASFADRFYINALRAGVWLVDSDDRRLRIEVGYGLEGAVPDAIAKRVVSEVIAPRFTAGDFPGGIEAGVDALIKIVSGEPLPPPAAKAPSGQGAEGDLESLFVLVMIMALAVGQVLRAVFGRLFGSLAVGGATGALALLIAGSLGMAALAGLAAFVFSLLGLSPAMLRGGGLGGGGFGGSRDGGFSGGGGRFGGGGASGGW